jgi:hypothetical protein
VVFIIDILKSIKIYTAVSGKTFTGSGSVDSYKDFYPKVANALEAGEKVTIEYCDIEEGK